MTYSHNFKENDQQARDSLLKYYSSSNNAHGTYVLTIAIGVFAFVQSISEVEKLIGKGLLFSLYLSFMISTFSLAGSYLFVRVLYWGMIAGAPIWTPPTSIREMTAEFQRANPGQIPDPGGFPTIYRLHDSIVKSFRLSHPFLQMLNSLKTLFLAVFLPSFILLLIHLNWASLSTLAAGVFY